MAEPLPIGEPLPAAASPTGAAPKKPPVPPAKPTDPTGKPIPYAAVPPPPPARATLREVRPAPEIPAAVSGVGSAKGVRWRGELASIERQAEATKAAKRAVAVAAAHGQPPPPEAAATVEEEEELQHDHVAKTAPPWLISTVIHLVLLLVLALITAPARRGISKLMLTFAQGEQSAPVELAEFTIDSDLDISDAPEDTEFDTDVPEIFETIEPTELKEVVPTEVGMGNQMIEIAQAHVQWP